ncbi:MAG: DnaJ domain-containing protein [Hyphomicrobiaceae bacterium]|nr:DnaJ domain-containing protein [Hyphomicrobiaceae bacterium]
MKLNSKYFDMIRIRPSDRESEPAAPDVPSCQWKGCDRHGEHRAPKGRAREGEFYLFCSDHVRQYNASYNYFDGMNDVEVEKFQSEARYGHRPTWKLGENAWSGNDRRGTTQGEAQGFAAGRSANAQNFHAFRASQARAEARQPQRRLKPIERKSLEALGLSETARREDIKSRFKALVKQHHPDANGGDRGSEDKLREIIQAYNYLKQVGLV